MTQAKSYLPPPGVLGSPTTSTLSPYKFVIHSGICLGNRHVCRFNGQQSSEIAIIIPKSPFGIIDRQYNVLTKHGEFSTNVNEVYNNHTSCICFDYIRTWFTCGRDEWCVGVTFGLSSDRYIKNAQVYLLMFYSISDYSSLKTLGSKVFRGL